MNKIKRVEEKYRRKEVPEFTVGDTVLVHVKIKEEGKTRIQIFDGIVIKRKGSGPGATFTVRRVSYGEGVERTFMLHSPVIDRIEVRRKGDVKKAKLYYLRERKGKKSKVAQKIERESAETRPAPESPSDGPSADRPAEAEH